MLFPGATLRTSRESWVYDMDKISKLIFTQAVMITTAILFGQGIIYAIIFLTGGQSSFEWEWYIPLSIVLAGILCALPTVLLDFPEKNDNGKIGRKYIHFICVGLIVTICGYVFGWYSTPTHFDNLCSDLCFCVGSEHLDHENR